jgi:anaerobic ribonucleoside-triphosphate reductase activating protein
MRYYDRQVVFQEVPNEISLVYSITGCPLRCKGCHSPFTWGEQTGQELTELGFAEDLGKYDLLISCVLFYGGEWHEEQLIQLLSIARNDFGLKTCLYTGQNSLSERIVEQLTFLKTGCWIEQLGGLQSPTTNQVLINVDSGENLNHYFIQQ